MIDAFNVALALLVIALAVWTVVARSTFAAVSETSTPLACQKRVFGVTY